MARWMKGSKELHVVGRAIQGGDLRLPSGNLGRRMGNTESVGMRLEGEQMHTCRTRLQSRRRPSRGAKGERSCQGHHPPDDAPDQVYAVERGEVRTSSGQQHGDTTTWVIVRGLSRVPEANGQRFSVHAGDRVSQGDPDREAIFRARPTASRPFSSDSKAGEGTVDTCPVRTRGEPSRSIFAW